MECYAWWQKLLDLLFPPSAESLRVRAISHNDLERLLVVSRTRGDIEYLFSYSHPDIKTILWQLKYKRDQRAAMLLFHALSVSILSRLHTPHLLVPIPLSAARMRERGYNQLDLVLSHAPPHAPHFTVCNSVLMRTQHRQPQTTLSRLERLQNVRGAFLVCDPAVIQGRDLLVLDDVTTTGATLFEARDVLAQAGARSVRLLALAH